MGLINYAASPQATVPTASHATEPHLRGPYCYGPGDVNSNRFLPVSFCLCPEDSRVGRRYQQLASRIGPLDRF